MSEQHRRNTGMLWGGRFAGGPSPSWQALSKSTHFDWRLAPYDLAGSRAHARVLHTAGLLTDDELSRLLEGSTSSTAASPPGEFVAGRVGRGRPRRPRARARRAARPRARWEAAGRPVPQRPDRHAVQGLPARPRPGRRRARARPRRGARRTGRDAPRCGHARAHPPAARPAGAARPTTCWRTPGRWSATSAGSRDWDARVAADSPYGSGRPGRQQPRPRPGGGRRATSASPARAANSIDGTAARDFVAEFAFVAAQIGVDVSRQAEEVILWATREFGFVTLARRLLDRVEHHAAEEEPRHRRAGPRQGRAADRQPHRAARHPQGAARWPTTGTCRRTRSRSSTPWTPSRCCCPRSPGMVATLTFDTARMAELAPQGFSLATDVAEWLVREGVPFRVAHEVAGACVRVCEERGIDLDGADRRRLRRDRPAAHAGGARGAHRRGLGRLPRRPRRHRAGARRRAARRAADRCRGAPWLAWLRPSPARRSRWRRRCSARCSGTARRGRRRGPAHRGRGVRRRRRPRLARLPGHDPSQRGDVRAGRPPLRVLHLRHAPLLQRRRRDRGARRPPCCCGPARSSKGVELARSRRPGSPTATWPAGRRGCARLWRIDAGTTAWTLSVGDLTLTPGIPCPVRLATGPRVGLREAADRPWRFWLRDDPTVSTYRPAAPLRRRPPSA